MTSGATNPIEMAANAGGCADAVAVAAGKDRVVVVEGDVRNVKITRPADLHAVRLLGGFKGPAERAVHKRF